MSPTELDEIEARFDLKLPADYREFLQAYPESLITTQRRVGSTEESPSERDLVNTSAALIQYNEHVRAPGVDWVRRGGPWPRSYFVIGDNQCGDYWCIDVDAGYSAVYWYDHERGIFERHHESVQDFADSVLEELREKREADEQFRRFYEQRLRKES